MRTGSQVRGVPPKVSAFVCSIARKVKGIVLMIAVTSRTVPPIGTVAWSGFVGRTLWSGCLPGSSRNFLEVPK